jgi:hypothetical protein
VFSIRLQEHSLLGEANFLYAWVGNQWSRGVVTARVQTDAVQSLYHQRRDLHKSTYHVPLRGLKLILLLSGIRFWVSRKVYLCVF